MARRRYTHPQLMLLVVRNPAVRPNQTLPRAPPQDLSLCGVGKLEYSSQDRLWKGGPSSDLRQL